MSYQSKFTGQEIDAAVNEAKALIGKSVVYCSTATVGQILEVAEVDESGKPTKWKAVEKPSGGASSWNDLPGRPFYSKVTEVLPETTVAIDQINLSVDMKTRLDIVDGGTYTVNWNGTEYVCVAKDVEQFGVVSTLLGNYAYNMGTGDTGEPFMIAVYDEETAAQYGGYATCIYAFDGSASVTLSVMGEVVKKLDKKYLPEYLQFGDKIEGQNSAVAWDGNTEGLPNVGNRYYKIYDYAPAFEDFAGGCVLEVTTPDGVIEEVHPAGDIVAYADGLAAIPNTLYSVGDAAAGVFVDGLVFPEPGLYVMNRPERAYVSSVTIPGYTFGEVKYTTIDPKYLPEQKEVSDAVSAANTAAGAANTAASAANDAANAANKATSSANTAAGNANSAANSANTAAGQANTAADTANTAAGSASTAAGAANTAAGNAQRVADEISQARANGEFDGKNGTSVTVSSVTESTVDGGTNVVNFSDGKKLNVKNGSKGSKGDKGDPYTLTDTDKNTIAAAVKASLNKETWNFTLEDGTTTAKAVYVG